MARLCSHIKSRLQLFIRNRLEVSLHCCWMLTDRTRRPTPLAKSKHSSGSWPIPIRGTQAGAHLPATYVGVYIIVVYKVIYTAAFLLTIAVHTDNFHQPSSKSTRLIIHIHLMIHFLCLLCCRIFGGSQLHLKNPLRWWLNNSAPKQFGYSSRILQRFRGL